MSDVREINVETGEETTRSYTAEELAALASYPPPPVPQSVTRFQVKAALSIAGKLAAAQALVDASTDPLVKLAWTEAATFERQSPLLLSLAPLLWPEDTDAHLDAIIVSAAGISV